jgi:hypothetical protein
MPRIPDWCPSVFRFRGKAVAPKALPSIVILLPLLFTFHDSFLTNVYAQSATATLSGTVKDETGAVVPNANISIISVTQGFERNTTTNGNGSFVVPLLPPGDYEVKAEHEGFAPAQVTGVVLNVNDQKIITVYLKVGKITQTVEIVDASKLIEESATVSTVVNRQFVDRMPLNGRSVQPLIGLAPGVVLTKTNGTEQGQFSVNGQRANSNYFTVDGVSANVAVVASLVPGQSGAGSLPGLSASGGTNNLVSLDALEEFKIQTSTFAPEFGRTPGAQVSMVTRAGTNDFHGSVFDYFRNDVLDAADWFVNANPALSKPPLRQNDFGGVLGGPLLMPRFGEGGPGFYHGKDRAFFFFSYEGLRLRQPLIATTDVPSLAARQTAAPAIQPFINLYPRPNGPQKANGLALFSGSFSNPGNLDATSVRIDGIASDKLTLFGRYNISPSESIGRGGVIQSLNTLSLFTVHTQTFSVGATYLPSATINNDLRFNYSRNKTSNFFAVDDFGGAIAPSESAIFPAGRTSNDAGVTINISGASQAAVVWGRRPYPVQRQINIVDNLSLLRGNHQLKLGVDYRRLMPIFNLQNYLTTLNFNGVGTAASAPAGTFLSGRTSVGNATTQLGPQTVIFNNFSLYTQDTWKTNARLTFTYGLRWDLNPPPHEANGRSALTLTQVDDPAHFAFAPRGTPLWKTTYGNFAPRAGLSYQLSSEQGRETIVRGGIGIFYDLGNSSAANAFVGAFPFTALKTLNNVPIPLSASDAAAPVPGATPTANDAIFVFDPELKLPRIYQWNLSIEQSLGMGQSITSSYVAALGRRLLRQSAVRNLPGFPGQFSVTTNDATSDYHALQVQFRSRLSRGFQALASYTWSHSIDIISVDSVNSTPSSAFDPRQDRGPSDFDVRHAFNGAFTYDIPAAHAGEFSKLLSNWSTDAIVTARSATPVNVVYPATTAFGTLNLRPDLVSGIPLYLDDPAVPGGRRFNNKVTIVPGNPNTQIGPFLQPTVVRQGTLGRNTLRGFPIWQLDLAVRRQFNLTDRIYMQFRTEVFNILNHPNFADPTNGLRNGTFGVSTTMFGKSLGSSGLLGGFNPLYQIGGPRSIQLSLKIGF